MSVQEGDAGVKNIRSLSRVEITGRSKINLTDKKKVTKNQDSEAKLTSNEDEFESLGSEEVEGEECEEEEDEEVEFLGPMQVTDSILKQVQQELGLIKLCWPNVEPDPETFEATLPESYKTNSDKERLLLWYAENFRRQYHTIYKNRKPLLLACDNECGVQKFVSTTIRRSTLPYPELYTWQGCAKFVSDHLSYELPKKALVMPDCLRSPTWVLRMQRGHSFEFATVLASFLLGQGYNAYVVSGYASREQVQCDLTKKPCPYLPKPAEPAAPALPVDDSKYRFRPPPDTRSKFLLEMEARERIKLEDELRLQEEERQKMILELERPPPDIYWGSRMHAWIVILPEPGRKRDPDITEPFFIEPTTGDRYDPTDHITNLLYLGIESIWNDENYWVNMQMCQNGCADLKWDLTKVELWEHLLPGEPWNLRGVEEEEADEDINIQQDKHLDMPSSWVEQIDIHSIVFERRYPSGHKCIWYKKTKVELFAPYVQLDGLTQRMTLYEDYEYTNPTKVYEVFTNRFDNLVKTESNVDTESKVDFYNRGRPDACKEHRYFEIDSDVVDAERTLDFYDVVRLDGLARIETHPLFLTQHYSGRDDRLYYRHVEYSNDKVSVLPNDANHRQVWKITEKYQRNEAISASRDLAVREFAIGDNEIRLIYHYEKGRGTTATRTFVKPSTADRGERLTFNPEMTSGYNPDPMAPPQKFLDLFYELDRQLREEERAMSCVRDAKEEVAVFLKTRGVEYSLPKLSVSLFDENRNEEAKEGMLAREEMLRAQSQREVEEEVDYLGPYLARMGNPSYLTRVQAQQVRLDCLGDFKQHMINRANNILRTFEKCNEELRLKQEALEVKDLPTEKQEELLEEISDVTFNLHALELRLNRHRDLVPERYRMMVQILQQDPRLAVLR